MKFKRIIFLFIILIMCILTNISLYASSTTASYKTFEIDGLDYVDDFYCNDNKTEINISGTTYEYGNMALWTALYTKYVESSDSKYYFLLVEAKLSSNEKSLKDGYYRMVNKKWSLILMQIMMEMD